MSDKEHLDIESEGDVAVSDEIETVEPKMFKVLLLNDDYTTMDFVVHVLETVFSKSPAEAVRIMMKVHKEGKGLCGVYIRQIAETKIALVHARAESENYPLRCAMEEA